MERLTFDGNFCDIAQCRELPCPYGGMCSQRTVWERLKEYEDTGLTPEAIEVLKLASMGCAIAEITEFDGVPLDRLRELAEADKDGRVCEVPCKVGDTVYELRDSRHAKGPGITPRIVARVLVSCGSGYVVYHSGPLGLLSVELGYTWFLTREEAEKALEAKRNG